MAVKWARLQTGTYIPSAFLDPILVYLNFPKTEVVLLLVSSFEFLIHGIVSRIFP
jgi:hypothetical protein